MPTDPRYGKFSRLALMVKEPTARRVEGFSSLVDCPRCHVRFAVKPMTTTARCPECGSELRVPASVHALREALRRSYAAEFAKRA